MYMPNRMTNKPHLDGAPNESRKKPPNKKLGALASALILLPLLIIPAMSLTESNKSVKAEHELLYDLGTLWKWGDEVFEGGSATADWQIRWNAEDVEAQMLDSIDEAIYYDSEGQATDKTITTDGATMRGDVSRLGGVVSIHFTERSETRGSYFITLESGGAKGGSEEELERAAAEISRVVGAHQPKFTSSIKAYAFTDKKDAVKEIQRLSQGKLLDDYRDGGTQVATLGSDLLFLSEKLSPRKTANVQISAHENTERKGIELTLGVPLLTGEFGSIGDNP
ncbi:hypothetical protein ACFQZE_11510 [Paenibacillus sp. GCM10027627]|uniref:hypothetical protein n=1 Tax=unclassified Paenibacillus TaxID=185978 RepID=UPI003640E36C